MAPDVNLPAGSTQPTRCGDRRSSRTPRPPLAGPFSCLPEAFPALLEDKRLFRGFQNLNDTDIMKFHVKPINKPKEVMNTRETLILKTLAWKQTLTGTGHGDLVDHLLEQNPEGADEITKNVCARIPVQLAKEMDTVGNMLDLNKREIITMALIDFLDKARDTLTEFKAWPSDVEEAE